LCAVNGVKGGKVRGVNLGNCLDGAKVRFGSLSLDKYVCAEDGGGAGVFVDQDYSYTWDKDYSDTNWGTFRLWRVSQSEYQFRAPKGQFLSCTGQGASVTATSNLPSSNETFTIASSRNELKADYIGTPGFNDGNSAIFIMTFVGDKLQGEYQISIGYGQTSATKVLTEHRKTYITREDFQYLSRHGINTIRVPVGWWITKDPNPPAPYIGGGLAALDNAFKWAQEVGIKCIVVLHAAPGSQNGKDHSSSRDGFIEWTKSDNIQQSLNAIEFLASKYGSDPALLGIELLSGPSSPEVPFDTLQKYYEDGYDIVRKHSATAYVIIMCQLIGNGADPAVLYHANTGNDKSNVVVDLHYFNVRHPSFDDMSALQNINNTSLFDTMSPQEKINYLYDTRKTQMNSLNATDGPLLFIGEWVNEFGRSGSQEDYQNFGRAQLDVYGSASFGWAYWSLKNIEEHWDLKWNIDTGYLPQFYKPHGPDLLPAGNDPPLDGFLVLPLNFGS
ncbi:hypothetical protein MKW98_026873, partial [Papaver atlanticum]